MDDFSDSLDRIKFICSRIVVQFEASEVVESIKILKAAVKKADKSWSGSWLGYHSRIYYDQLQPVPPGARFSQEWGMQFYPDGTRGEWRVVEFDALYNALKSNSTNFSLEQLKEIANHANEEISDLRAELLSIIFSCLANGEDAYLNQLKEETEKCKTLSTQQIIEYLKPSRYIRSHDRIAESSGLEIPPHIYLHAQLSAIQEPTKSAKDLRKIANWLLLHLTNKSRAYMHSSQPGTHIFIGHGHSHLWRDLKDFISDRMNYPAASGRGIRIKKEPVARLGVT